MSKSEFQDDGNMSNDTGRNQEDESGIKENFQKVKAVFDILIAEASFLIDDKAYAMCEGKTQKEQFLIMIDSIRKSLGIDSMEDVELLVESFYQFGEKKRKRLEDEEEKRLAAKREEDELNGIVPIPPVAKDAKKQSEKKDGQGKNAPAEVNTYEDIEEEGLGDGQPDINLDDVVEVLQDFHGRREEKLNNQDLVGNPSMKKKSNFLSDEEKQKRQKREEKVFWERLTKVLSDKGVSVW